MELNKLIKRAETLALKKDFFSLEVLEVNLEILKCERNPGAITRIGRFYKERKEFEKSLEYYKLIDKNDDLIYQNISQRNILDINKEIKEIKEENKNKTAISQLKNLEACFKFVLRKEMNSALKLNLIQKAKSLVKTENKKVGFYPTFFKSQFEFRQQSYDCQVCFHFGNKHNSITVLRLDLLCSSLRQKYILVCY